MSQLVRLEGKLDFQGNRDFQTLNSSLCTAGDGFGYWYAPVTDEI